MEQAIRVLLVTKSTGGVAEYVRWLVSGFDKKRFSLTVLCLSENGPEFAQELQQNHDVSAFSYAMDRYKVNLLSDTRVGLQLIKLLRTNQFDLVHAHASKPGFLIRVAKIGTHIPILYSPHCFAFHEYAGRLKIIILAFLERLAALLTTRFIAIAEGERELAQSHRVGKAEQFVVIHTGIDPKPYRQPVDVHALKASLNIPASAPVIGSVGRLSEQKSPLDFVRAAEAVHRSKPEAHFVWVGTGPLEAEARQLSASLRLESVIHWLGQRSDVPSLFHVFDCFLLTSRWEGFPLVILEAMAAGVPVVATDIPGTRDAIRHGVNGWLAPVGDPDTQARFILDILADPVRTNLFRSASRSRIDTEFTRERMIALLQNIYEQVVRENERSNN